MSEKYCPAGKCECEYFCVQYSSIFSACAISETSVLGYEVCPWPSRQKWTERSDRPHDPNDPIDVAQKLAYEKGFNDGRIEQARVDRKAVGKQLLSGMAYRFEIIAALSSVAPEDGRAKEAEHDAE